MVVRDNSRVCVALSVALSLTVDLDENVVREGIESRGPLFEKTNGGDEDVVMSATQPKPTGSLDKYDDFCEKLLEVKENSKVLRERVLGAINNGTSLAYAQFNGDDQINLSIIEVL